MKLDDPYNIEDLKSNLALTFEFKNAYGLIPNATGDKVYDDAIAAGTDTEDISTSTPGDPTQHLVAQMDQKTGVVQFAKTDAAEKLLNNPTGHLDLTTTVTARIGYKAVLCGTPGAAQIPGITVPFSTSATPKTQGEFDVKFLCPITVLDDGTNVITDAITGGDDAKLKLTFVDWRDHEFTTGKFYNATTGTLSGSDQRKGNDYFAYYGVKSIKVDFSKATTNFADTSETDYTKWGKVSTVIPTKKFTFIEETDPTKFKNGSFGKIHYENDGTNHGDYKVRVNVEVTYDWGVIDNTYVTFTVKKTQSNARRR